MTRQLRRSTQLQNNQLQRLIVDNQERLYKIAFSYVKNPQDALDIVQETAYKACLSYHKVRQPQYAVTWLIRIVINTSIDFLRKRKKMVTIGDHVIDNIQESHTDQPDTKMMIWDAIDRLSERQKTVIILRYFEDMKLKDIARTLQWPESTVKSVLYRTLDEMKIGLME